MQREPAGRTHDGVLLRVLTRIFVETVHRFYAKHTGNHGESLVKGGAVTVVQRTSSDSLCGAAPCFARDPVHRGLLAEVE